MTPSSLLFLLLILTGGSFFFGKRRAQAMTDGVHSRSVYYGVLTALWCAVPALIIFFGWLAGESVLITHLVVSDLSEQIRNLSANRLGLVLSDIRSLAAGHPLLRQPEPWLTKAADHYRELSALSRTVMVGTVLATGLGGAFLTWRKIVPRLRARNHVEGFFRYFLIACSTFAIFTTVGIVLSVLFESIRFFKAVPVTEFLFGLEWSPQMAIRADQIGSSGAFGAVPVFVGTLMISLIAMLVAVPLGLMAAIYLSEYADKQMRMIVKPLLEILAGVPTVVYGFFAALTVAPLIRAFGGAVGLDVSSESALAAGLVMGIMIIPFVSSLSDDVINAVPQAMRDGSYALGATTSETIRQVVIPAALPGIVGGILLAVSRAIGETMIVVMAAGLTANMTVNPLKTVTTVTVQIVTLLVGDQEFDSPKTLAAFALGLVLFLVTLILNIIALHVVRKYREQYE